MKIVGKITSVRFLSDVKSDLKILDGEGEYHSVLIDDFTRETLPFNLCMNTMFIFEVADGHVVGVERI